MYILNIQIYFSDSGRFLCVNAYFGHQYILFYFLFQIMVNRTEKSVEFTKGISSTHN